MLFAILQENLLFFGFFVVNITNLSDKAFVFVSELAHVLIITISKI